MRVFETVADYVAEKGNEIGVSDWVTIDQDRVNLFADATGDHQWIHIDPERTKKELGMGTIAHGYLTLSLLPLDPRAASRQPTHHWLRVFPCVSILQPDVCNLVLLASAILGSQYHGC